MFTVNGKQVETLTDETLVGLISAKKLFEDGTLDFSLADQSTAPFAWMVEGVEAGDVDDAAGYVKAFVERDCNVYNYSSLSDDDLAAAIMAQGLANGAIGYIKEWKMEALADNAIEVVTVGNPEPVADTTVLVLNTDGTYSVCDNGEEVVCADADEAKRIIIENLTA